MQAWVIYLLLAPWALNQLDSLAGKLLQLWRAYRWRRR